ncbi:hypothetical protein [Phocaeicola sp.]
MKAFFFIASMLLLISCNNDNGISHESEEHNTSYEIVLKERDPECPLIFPSVSDSRNMLEATRSTSLPFIEYLGNSFKFQEIPIGHGKNFIAPVVNIKKILKDDLAYATEKSIRHGEQYSFGYASFDRFYHKSTTSKKIKDAGFSLNLGLFNVGAKHSMTEIFSSTVINETNRIYGELNVELINSYFKLQTSSYIYDKIKIGYLHPAFMGDLYNTTPGELLSNYGRLVVVDFITGGSASAVYTGVYTGNETIETKEKDMESAIKSSYGFDYKEKGDGNVSANLGFGKGYSDSVVTTNKLTDIRTSIKTIGGALGNASFSIPKEIGNVDINLNDWAASLNDENTHAIIEIDDEGLVPIVLFVLEENLIDRIKALSTEDEIKIEQLQEPYIEIMRRRIPSLNMELLISSIVTKWGDRIVLGDTYRFESPTSSEVNDKIIELKNQYAKIYRMKIINRYLNDDITPLVPSYTYQYFIYENKLKKYVDEENNKTYLLYENSEQNICKNVLADDYLQNLVYSRDFHSRSSSIGYGPSGRFAISIYGSNMDLYGLREYVDSLPVANIDRESLKYYKIVAL